MNTAKDYSPKTRSNKNPYCEGKIPVPSKRSDYEVRGGNSFRKSWLRPSQIMFYETIPDVYPLLPLCQCE